MLDDYLIIAAPVLGIVLLAWLITSLRRRRSHRAFRETAERFGMAVLADGGLYGEISIAGEVDGHDLRVRTETVKAGGSSRLYRTIYSARLMRPLGFSMVLRREGLTTKLDKIFGEQDIEVGQPDFDGRYLIQGNDPQAIRTFLTRPRVQRLLDEVIDSRAQLELEERHLRVRRAGHATSVEEVTRQLQHVKRLAAELVDAVGPGTSERRISQPVEGIDVELMHEW